MLHDKLRSSSTVRPSRGSISPACRDFWVLRACAFEQRPTPRASTGWSDGCRARRLQQHRVSAPARRKRASQISVDTGSLGSFDLGRLASVDRERRRVGARSQIRFRERGRMGKDNRVIRVSFPSWMCDAIVAM
jgi:hypothetical protein